MSTAGKQTAPKKPGRPKKQATTETITPKRRGRPPGTKNKVKQELDQEYVRYSGESELTHEQVIDRPRHYTFSGIETIDFIEAKALNHNLASVVAYISRAPLKNDYLQDLKKAQWYLVREIRKVEKINAQE